MTTDPLHGAVVAEIGALHEFFVAWFPGRMPETDAGFTREFVARFDADFVLIQPGGELLERETFLSAIRAGHDGNPGFRVAIRNVRVRRHMGDHVLATYEEWQRGAKASKPSDNGRVATVLFRREGERLRWLHVHETWLPQAVMAQGPYDF